MPTIPITIAFKEETHRVELDPSESVSTLRVQIFSLTGVPPEEQRITGLGPGVLRDDADLGAVSVNLLPGTWVMLDRCAPSQPQPLPQPQETIGEELRRQQACAEMQSRLRSGFRTASAYEDPALQQQARSLIPWAAICEEARRKGSGSGQPPEASAEASAALRQMRAEPALTAVASAARSDPTQLAPMLQQLSLSSPALLELVKANQGDFRALLTAEEAGPPPGGPAGGGPDEAELKELLRWFKRDFFTWVNAPECELTGQPTEPIGMGEPTGEEKAWGAGRVELYRGPTGHVTRFPRYNHPAKLLQTRKGRCGEWANAFTLCCMAVGFRARWVLDVTDHVRAHRGRQQPCTPALEKGEPTHPRARRCGPRCGHPCAAAGSTPTRASRRDTPPLPPTRLRRTPYTPPRLPCEQACDAPLLYERGWGKKLSYVFSFGAHECVDVARRYSASWSKTLARL